METKKDIKTDEVVVFPRYKAHSIKEVLAAGGTTAFANKMGKSTERMIKNLEELPKESFLTEEEFQAAIATLNASK